MRTEHVPRIPLRRMIVVAFALAALLCAGTFTLLSHASTARDGSALAGADAAAGAAPTVDGRDVLVIGDSVTVAARHGLERTFPGVRIDAEVGTQLASLDRLLTEAEDEGPLPEYVVIALGTNGEAPESVLEKALGRIGPDRRMVLVTPHGDRQWMPHVRETFDDFARSHPDQVAIADWDGASDQVTDFADDGIHPGPQGGRILAGTVREAIEGLDGGEAR